MEVIPEEGHVCYTIGRTRCHAMDTEREAPPDPTAVEVARTPSRKPSDRTVA